LIRVMRRLELNNNKKTVIKTETMTLTNTFREHPERLVNFEKFNQIDEET